MPWLRKTVLSSKIILIMKKIAIVGNRKGWSKKQIFNILDTYCLIGENTNIITGGAIGVDSYVMEYAKLKGCMLTVYYPDYITWGKHALRERNEKIAWNCETLIAFNKNDNQKSGTSQTIRFAKRFKKFIIYHT
jgi:predicted Rossmann fold nucleotide-binding protein DprA/Smf involved in DNA uptake